MARRFRIHPSIGIARVGNAPQEFFIGPEHPGIPANFANGSFASFRDAQGRIKRQAARFTIFSYDEQDGRLSNPREVTLSEDIVNIEWRVHVANRKASFFTFDGQKGAEDAYVTRSHRPATDHQKDEPDRANKRNPTIAEADRARLLELDAGERVISTGQPARVILGHNNPNVPFIADLGELQMDGPRLLFLGGHGTSGSTSNPPIPIDEYANNDTWFDDVADGSIKARIQFNDGTTADADAAWVTVGPPDFAPGIGNVVCLYDTLWDVAVRQLSIPLHDVFTTGALRSLRDQQQAWRNNNSTSLAGYRPSFTNEIYPLLSRALLARRTFQPHEIDKNSFHVALLRWEQLSDATENGRPAREYVLRRMRDPNNQNVDWIGMPRSLGDDYDDLGAGQPKHTSFLNLTHIQYALLHEWAAGNFVNDWPGQEPPIPAPGPLTPDGLDRAALENSVGGPFYPGIEVSWLCRRTELYAEPFRLNVPTAPAANDHEPPVQVGALTFQPGFFSQQMALPWQADFYDCHKEEWESQDDNPEHRYYMWWTAQRPDDVYPNGANEQRPWVQRFYERGATDENLERFVQMQQHWHELRFVILNADRYEEEP